MNNNNTVAFYSTRKIIHSGRTVSAALLPLPSAIHLDVSHPPHRVYMKMAQTTLSRVKMCFSWTGRCSVCPRCQLEDALIRTGRKVSVELQARWWFLHFGEDDMEVIKGELGLSPDYVLWKGNLNIKANCIEVVTPAPKKFWSASTAKEMEYWIKPVRTNI